MIALNTQPPEAVVRDELLEVVEVWHTLQGEGPFAGMPAVFVRTAGCNLDCPSCDTNYTSNRKHQEGWQVFDTVQDLFPRGHTGKRLIVITGGEPFRQPVALANFLNQVHLGQRTGKHHYTVQIETNGTLWDPRLVEVTAQSNWDAPVYIVCSPKTPGINQDLLHWVDAFKYVLKAGEVAEDGLPTRCLGMEHSARVYRPDAGSGADIYLQPLDEQDAIKNAANLQACVDSCLKFGYRLSVQLHKLVGVL